MKNKKASEKESGKICLQEMLTNIILPWAAASERASNMVNFSLSLLLLVVGMVATAILINSSSCTECCKNKWISQYLFSSWSPFQKSLVEVGHSLEGSFLAPYPSILVSGDGPCCETWPLLPAKTSVRHVQCMYASRCRCSSVQPPTSAAQGTNTIGGYEEHIE